MNQQSCAILQLNTVTRPELFEFEDISMTHYFTDNWEKVQNFQARPDDILVATYPKAGKRDSLSKNTNTANELQPQTAVIHLFSQFLVL